MEYKILIVGHSQWPVGIRSLLEFVTGIDEGVDVINLDHDNSLDQFKTKLNSYFEKNKNVIVFADIVGGAPHRVTAETILSQKDAAWEIIAGPSASLIIDVVVKIRFLKVKNHKEFQEFLVNLMKQLSKYTLLLSK